MKILLYVLTPLPGSLGHEYEEWEKWGINHVYKEQDMRDWYNNRLRLGLYAHEGIYGAIIEYKELFGKSPLIGARHRMMEEGVPENCYLYLKSLGEDRTSGCTVHISIILMIYGYIYCNILL